MRPHRFFIFPAKYPLQSLYRAAALILISVWPHARLPEARLLVYWRGYFPRGQGAFFSRTPGFPLVVTELPKATERGKKPVRCGRVVVFWGFCPCFCSVGFSFLSCFSLSLVVLVRLARLLVFLVRCPWLFPALLVLWRCGRLSFPRLVACCSLALVVRFLVGRCRPGSVGSVVLGFWSS
ncbi:hypothetical protein SYNPCC7002_E0024 (plasmid) [Picosynechococcus sp. PCC 7002]|nr:hypothetical protein SYNPCC7002_E0024 [Picosynechococcus sp. PCC 7002]